MGGKNRRRHEAKMMSMNKEMLEMQLEEMRVQREVLEKQKAEYRKIEFQNPYADMENFYAGMDNVFEDMTVDRRAADFQKQMVDQQRADILGQMRGMAGSSGIASLAQTLANQGQMQAMQTSLNVAQQERQNAMMSRQMAGQLQVMERRGAHQADMTFRGGEAMVEQAEMSRQSTLLGMEFGGMTGAQAGVTAAQQNVMHGMGYIHQGYSQRSAMWGNIAAGAAIGLGLFLSDRDIKKNIKKIGKSDSGLNIYQFEYKDPEKHGEGVYQGVVADDLPKEIYKEAVSEDKDGNENVNYDVLDVEFKRIK